MSLDDKITGVTLSPLPSSPKPGYKTTEFWITVVTSIGGLLAASGAFAENSPWLKIVGLIVAAATSMGYTASRAQVKNG